MPKKIQSSFIGVGLGGANMAKHLADTFGTDRLGLINMSEQDIRSSGVPEERCLIFGETGGAGKDRRVARSLFANNLDRFADLATKVMAPGEDGGVDITFVCFSTAGGTGSGIGPALTAYLGSEEISKKTGNLNSIVMGIAIVPDLGEYSEGIKSMSNTSDALSEINKFTTNRIASFALVSNGYSKKKKMDEKHPEINRAVAGIVHRYCSIFSSSRTGNLDIQDRLGGLKTPGIHSFFTYKVDENEGKKASSPFIVPEDSRSRGLYCEVPEGSSEEFEAMIGSLGIVPSDSILGFYDEESTPIVHTAGSDNLSKVSEAYHYRLKQLKQQGEKAESVDRSGTGFKNTKEDRDWVKREYSTQKASGAEDIVDMLMEDD